MGPAEVGSSDCNGMGDVLESVFRKTRHESSYPSLTDVASVISVKVVDTAEIGSSVDGEEDMSESQNMSGDAVWVKSYGIQEGSVLKVTLLGGCRPPIIGSTSRAASSNSVWGEAFPTAVRFVSPDRSGLACLVLLPDAGDRTSKPDVCRRRVGLGLTGASLRATTDALRERVSSASRSLFRASCAIESPPTQTEEACVLLTGIGCVVGVLWEMGCPQTVGVLLPLMSSSSCIRKGLDGIDVRSGSPSGRRTGVVMLVMMLAIFCNDTEFGATKRCAKRDGEEDRRVGGGRAPDARFMPVDRKVRLDVNTLRKEDSTTNTFGHVISRSYLNRDASSDEKIAHVQVACVIIINGLDDEARLSPDGVYYMHRHHPKAAHCTNTSLRSWFS
jgi:hypothetical protein